MLFFSGRYGNYSIVDNKINLNSLLTHNLLVDDLNENSKYNVTETMVSIMSNDVINKNKHYDKDTLELQEYDKNDYFE